MKRATTAAAVALCIAFALLFGGVFVICMLPMSMDAYDFSLIWPGEAMPEGWTYDQKGWTVYTVRDGQRHALTANGMGGFYGDVEPGETFYFSRTLAERTSAPILRVDAYGLAVAVFLDGEPLYADAWGQSTAIGEIELPAADWARSEPILVPLPEDYLGKELTIAQSAGAAELDMASAQYVVYPCAVSLASEYAYESGLIAESLRTAVPATLLLCVGLILLAAFVLRIWRGEENGSYLCASLFLLLAMSALLTGSSLFPMFRPAIHDAFPNLAELCRSVALSALLAFLASRAKRLRALPWALAALNAASCALKLGMELTHDAYTDDLSLFLRDVPFQLSGLAGLAVAFLCAWLLWRREGRFYRLFAPLSSAGLGVLALCDALLRREAVLEQLRLAAANLQPAYFLWRLMSVAVAAAGIAAVIDLLGQELGRRIEARQMAERAAMSMASYESLRTQQEQVMMLRHDINRHLYMLRQLLDEGGARAYLEDLIGRNENIPDILHSGNQMIDIILNGRLASARASGIAVVIRRAQAPDALTLKESDLCSLLLNLVDNAIAAANASGAKQPFIHLDLHVNGHYFVLSCENTCAADEQGKKEARGLGLKIVDGIVERYGCLMEAERTAQTYKVTVAVPIH